MSSQPPRVIIRNTRREDFEAIGELSRLVYPDGPGWQPEQLDSHLRVFPQGQFVAVERDGGHVIGMAASLIVHWADYEMHATWRDFTDRGMFSNHDPSGRTLYGAEVLVRPKLQRRGIGAQLYRARRELTQRLELRRIRAAARLRGYHRVASRMTAEEYVIHVVHGKMQDPTLSFQLREGFEVLAVVSAYLRHDSESRGYAAVIEWLNPLISTESDAGQRDPRFLRSGPR